MLKKNRHLCLHTVLISCCLFIATEQRWSTLSKREKTQQGDLSESWTPASRLWSSQKYHFSATHHLTRGRQLEHLVLDLGQEVVDPFPRDVPQWRVPGLAVLAVEDAGRVHDKQHVLQRLRDRLELNKRCYVIDKHNDLI